MISQLTVVEWLLEEASKLSITDNPLKGSIKEPGDQVVGTLLEDEWKLFRLTAHYHDVITSKIGNGITMSIISEAEKAEVDRLTSLRKCAEDLVRQNIFFRLGWKYSKLGFLEDGTIVSFVHACDNDEIDIQAMVLAEPIILGQDKRKMN
jgi:hypothetical protein